MMKRKGSGRSGMREDGKRAVVEALGLPRDVMMGDILLHFTCTNETEVENLRSLLN